MPPEPKKGKRILILCYSFSGQTSAMVRRMAEVLEAAGNEIHRERIEPMRAMRFPVSGIPATMVMMVTTFLRFRIPIQPLSPRCHEDYDLIILAGPTWSYNPSGPVLSLMDRDGPRLFTSKTVLPFISCRGYWRLHWAGLRKMLQRCGAAVPNVMIFSHPNPEPWRTLGVFLKIAGKTPERAAFIGRRYKKFGHSREQIEEAGRFAGMIHEALVSNLPLADLDFQTPIALP